MVAYKKNELVTYKCDDVQMAEELFERNDFMAGLDV